MAASIMLWSGCTSLRTPLQTQFISGLGRIEFRKSDSRINGVVVGAPHGIAEPSAVDYAMSISNRTGAGVVIAYGFQSKRIPVTQPLVRTAPLATGADNPRQRGSIYPEFKALLGKAANGPLKFYLGIRIAEGKSNLDRIEVATSGLTFEQLRALEKSFVRIRDQEVKDTDAPTVDVVLDPLDQISWRISGVKHHGVLMLAERGLILRLPARLSAGAAQRYYERVLSRWILGALDMIRRNPTGLPKSEVTVLDFGKIETIPGKQKTGIVVGAPHGTFDVYTAGTVRQICARSGLAGVIATGFTPTETGGGWRINVNRPSELYYPAGNYEVESARAAKAYQYYKAAVTKAAHGDLRLYFDIHQNGGQRIEVATVGISQEEARYIKNAYYTLRDQALEGRADIAVVELAIEPLDDIEVGAWAAKSNGILRLARKSLHFELPGDGIMASARHREVYTPILADLISKAAARFTRGD